MKIKGILIVAVVFWFYSCNQNIFNVEDNKRKEIIWNETEVKLLNNVDERSLYLNDDQIVTLLIEKSASRSIEDINLSSESNFTLTNFENALNNIYLNNKLPNFSAKNQNEIMANVDIIQLDFPNYTKDDILANYVDIIDFYHQQLKYLVATTITSQTVSLSRGFPLGSGNDGLYYDNKLFTWHEVKACAAHPLSAVTLKSAVDKARSLTADVYGSYTITDEQSDAYRHTVLNIVLAKYGVGFRDEKIKWASDFATAHEKGTNDKGAASYMDLHNNRIGRAYYKSNTNISYFRVKAFGKTLYKIATGVSSEPTDSEMRRDIKLLADDAVFIPGYNKNDTSSAHENLIESRIDNVSSNVLVYIDVD